MEEKKAATGKRPASTTQKVVAKPLAAPKQAAAPKRPREKIGIGRLLGMLGGILTLVGALLPWATLAGGTLASKMFLGIQTGFIGVLVSQLGFFGIFMMLDGKKTTSIGGIVLGAAALVFSGLAAAYVGLLSLGNIGGSSVDIGPGLYVCVVGPIILLLGSIMAMIDAGKPRTIPIPPAKPAKKGKPIEAYLLLIAAAVGAVLLLAYPWNPWTNGRLDAVGAVYFLFGLMLAASCYYAYKVEYWSWGTVLIVMILIVLFGVLASTLVLLAYADALAFVLFYTQKTYGVGVWKIDQARDEQQRKIREVKRTANPEGLHCPRCKSTDVYICDDGSTFCRSCKTGFVNIKDSSAKPKSSMQGV